MDLRLKRYQKEFDHSYAFGVFATLELLAERPEQVLTVVLASKGERNDGVQKLGDECSSRGIPVEIGDATIERLSPRESHLAVGVFRKYETRLSAEGNQVVLVNPGDMGNLGAIARTLVGFGLSDLALIRPAADLFDPRAIRASMGAIFRLAFRYFDCFEQYQADTRHHLYPLMTDGRQSIEAVAFEPPYALIFGSESSGLPSQFQAVGTSVRIPHTDRVDSLNLSVAVGIALFSAGHA
jgi:TrmH family RNA methyltransferase